MEISTADETEDAATSIDSGSRELTKQGNLESTQQTVVPKDGSQGNDDGLEEDNIDSEKVIGNKSPGELCITKQEIYEYEKFY